MVVVLQTSIEIKGVPEVIKYLQQQGINIKNGLKEGIKDSTIMVSGEVKLSIAGRRAETRSVDTGQFLNSIDYSCTNDEGKVFSNVNHAIFLEYGTSKIAPRRHFRNSLFRNQPKINRIIFNRIKSSLS